jgi:hypothetical protein
LQSEIVGLRLMSSLSWERGRAPYQPKLSPGAAHQSQDIRRQKVSERRAGSAIEGLWGCDTRALYLAQILKNAELKWS